MESQESDAPEKEDIRQLISAARAMAKGDLKKELNAELYGEVGDLAKYLNEVFRKLQLAETEIQQASAQIPFGAKQLSDVTRFTEEATHRILEYSEKVIRNQELMTPQLEFLKEMAASGPLDQAKTNEKIDNIGALLADNKKILMDIVFSLEFQDLTAQRLRKIGMVMQEIQSRILKLVVTFGAKAGTGAVTADKQEALLGELAAERLDQGLVDDILKEFGF